MEKLYVVIPKNCTGCRTCELSCSMVKGREGQLGRSRISVHKTGEAAFMQMNCFQCLNAACAQVCPTKAIARNEETGAVVIDDELCVGCALCETACPFGHMYFDRNSGKPLKCDLCGGDPACAKFCPDRALEMRS